MVFTHPNGAVSVSGAALGNTSALQTVQADGAKAFNVPMDATPEVEAAASLTEAGPDNTVFTLAHTTAGFAVQTYVVAYRNGVKLWSVTPPDTCKNQLETVHALKLGTDGHVYMVSSRATGCSGQEFFLSKLHKTTGATLFRVSLGGYFPVGSGTVFAYSGGIALLSSPLNVLRYYSAAGKLVSQAKLALAAGESVGGATADHKGRLYVIVAAYQAATATCSWTLVNKRIDVFGPKGKLTTGGQPLQYLVPPCSLVNVPQAAPTGMAFVLRNSNDERLVVRLGAAMKPMWDAPFSTGTIGEREFLPWLGHDLTVDNNGNVVMLGWYQRGQYRGAQVKVLSGATGKVQSVVYTDQLNSDVSFRVTQVGLAQSRLYLAAQTCNANQCDGSSKVTLYAVPVNGLGLDYPRARLLGLAPTVQATRKYVALGDSFSAGLGIEPYMQTGCGRSKAAYPELLDEMPGLNLDLVNFVACSGATTEDVERGMGGEPSQLKAFTKDTDVVTLTVGGNDVGFKDFGNECLAPWNDHCDQSPQYRRTLNSIQKELPGKLDRLYESIIGKIGDNTQVLVLGYPQLMPSDEGELRNCITLTQAERTAAKQVTWALNGQIQAAVERLADSRFAFVDADTSTSPIRNHELCNDDSYFFGVSAPDVGVSLHPNRLGAAAYAELVRRQLVQ